MGMKEYKSKGRLVFNIFNYIIIIFMMLSCLVPLIHILALSFSGASYTDSNMVTLIPKGFTLAAYKYVMQNSMFWRAFGVTITRLAVGVPLGLLLTILAAYPLSKEEQYFPARKIYMWLFMFVMIFNAGLVPTYLLIKDLKMMDTIWALVLPMGVNVFNIVLMMNFFRGIPREIEESAEIDGCGKIQMFFSMILPLAKPGLATLAIYNGVNMWNEFSFAYTLTQSSANRTLPLAIWEFQGQYSMNTPMIMAVLTLTLLPMIIMFIIFQDKLVKGMTAGAVKG